MKQQKKIVVQFCTFNIFILILNMFNFRRKLFNNFPLKEKKSEVIKNCNISEISRCTLNACTLQMK